MAVECAELLKQVHTASMTVEKMQHVTHIDTHSILTLSYLYARNTGIMQTAPEGVDCKHACVYGPYSNRGCAARDVLHLDETNTFRQCVVGYGSCKRGGRLRKRW